MTTPYCDPVLMNYLDRYYSTQGHPDFSRLEGEHFCLATCGVCGLIYQDRVPTDEFSMELYEKWITPQNPSALTDRPDESARRFRNIRLIRRIIRHLSKPSHQVRVIDIGMGWADWLFAARGLGCQVYGLELSPARIAHGVANGVSVLTWGDLSRNTFDIINCEQVLEHLEDPRGALETMRECLAPNGIIVAGVPNVLPLERRLRAGEGIDWSGERHTRQHYNATEAVTPLEHLNSFTGKSLRSLASRCGLTEVQFAFNDLIQTTALDYDSLKDLAKDVLIRLGFTNAFTSVVLTRRSP